MSRLGSVRAVAFVGEASGEPGSRMPGGGAFDPRTDSGRRLAALVGVESVPERYPTVNLLEDWPGRDRSGGSTFPIGAARAAADALWPSLPPVAVLAGRRVASAFGLSRLGWLSLAAVRRDGLTRTVALIPHPSGTNRWWNDPARVEAAATFVRALLADATGVLDPPRVPRDAPPLRPEPVPFLLGDDRVVDSDREPDGLVLEDQQDGGDQ